MLRKLLPPSGKAAKFDDDSLRVGRIDVRGRRMICAFNWGEQPQSLTVRFGSKGAVTDYWSGAAVDTKGGALVLKDMPGRSARLFNLG